jgi:hypothetical protein
MPCPDPEIAIVTPEERDRLAKVEIEVRMLSGSLGEMNRKLDQLIAAANMGKGAWWLLLRLGGILVVLAAAAAWIVDHFGWIK